MKTLALLFLLIVGCSCATIKNPQNWNDDMQIQKMHSTEDSVGHTK